MIGGHDHRIANDTSGVTARPGVSLGRRAGWHLSCSHLFMKSRQKLIPREAK
jgi:hypothetical protein